MTAKPRPRVSQSYAAETTYQSPNYTQTTTHDAFRQFHQLLQLPPIPVKIIRPASENELVVRSPKKGRLLAIKKNPLEKFHPVYTPSVSKCLIMKPRAIWSSLLKDAISVPNPDYLDIAETISERGTCLRKNFGAIIVKNDEIISTGYTGAPRGRENCIDLGYCTRQKCEMPSGKGYERCRSVHSEQNAIISAARKDMIGATLYLVGINQRNGEYVKDNEPCSFCKRMIINAGIEKVVMRDTKKEYRVEEVENWIKNDDTIFKEEK